MTSLAYQLAILRARESGFIHFATALETLYRREYPVRKP